MAILIDNSEGSHTLWVKTAAELPSGQPKGTLCLVRATGLLYIVDEEGTWVTLTA